nr:MAG TPA: DNA binding protein [Caudoviricetes sp.]
MNKLELIKKICEKTEQKQNEVDATLKAFASVIIEEVRDGGEDVQIPGVGIFKQKVNPAHTCRNPFNGENVEVKESTTIKFQVSSAVKKVSE